MAEQNNEPQTARERDQLQQELAIASSIAEKQARKPAETKTISNENSGTDDSNNSNPAEIENNLGEQKGIENKKNGKTEQLGDVVLELGKKRLKFLLLPSALVIGKVVIITLGLIFVIFNVTMAYKCYTESSWFGTGVLFYKYWTDDYVGVLNKVYSGTCGVSDTPAPNSTKNPPAAEPTPAANIAPDSTAQ